MSSWKGFNFKFICQWYPIMNHSHGISDEDHHESCFEDIYGTDHYYVLGAVLCLCTYDNYIQPLYFKFGILTGTRYYRIKIEILQNWNLIIECECPKKILFPNLIIEMPKMENNLTIE